MKTAQILIIDNYDSFTYNLVHMVEELTGKEVVVLKNDAFEIELVEHFDKIILSPGPGLPDEAGLLKEVIKTYGEHKKILGVCLGLQAIGEVFGATLRNLDMVYHGQRSLIHQTNNRSHLFDQLSDTFYAGRYHSWVIDKGSDISQLTITAVDDQGEIMAAEHNRFPVFGVQFHPESIMTDEGMKIIANFLEIPSIDVHHLM